MKISAKANGDWIVMAVSGRLDATTSPELEKEIAAWWAPGSAKNLLLDMTELAYISSAGLRIILAASKKLKAAGGKIALSGLQPLVMDVFRISGFEAVIPIFASPDEAMR